MHVIGALLGLDNDDVKTIGAAATTIGVLLALFGPGWRRWWRSPLLTIQYQDKQGEPHWDHVLLGSESFFLRLRVSNAAGCDAAADVQVIVSGFRSDLLGLDERPLEWSGQRRKRPVTSTAIPPGVSRHVDLLQIKPVAKTISKPDPKSTAKQTPDSDLQSVAHVCVYPPPWGGAHMFRPGDHDIRLTVTASNADATRYSMTVRFKGELSACLLAPPQRDRTTIAQGLRRRLKNWMS